MQLRRRTLLGECFAEVVGTFLLVFLGTASAMASVVRSTEVVAASYSVVEVAVTWGVALIIGTVAASPVSGAHLNPAVTMALAFSPSSDFLKRKAVPYVAAQLVGAAGAGLLVLTLFGGVIHRLEALHDVARGTSNSTLSAMTVTNYFPNPVMVHMQVLEVDDMSFAGALILEALGSALLVLVFRTVTDRHNLVRPVSPLAAFYIGCSLTAVMAALGPLMQVSLNPARDLGPRIVAYLAGWSTVALPGPRNEFVVYLFGPLVGALIAVPAYECVLLPAYRVVAESPTEALLRGLHSSVSTIPNKSSLTGSLPLEPGKGLHHSDFRDSPTLNLGSYDFTSPTVLTQSYLRQQLDLV